jgi:hypothetical protein
VKWCKLVRDVKAKRHKQTYEMSAVCTLIFVHQIKGLKYSVFYHSHHHRHLHLHSIQYRPVERRVLDTRKQNLAIVFEV